MPGWNRRSADQRVKDDVALVMAIPKVVRTDNGREFADPQLLPRLDKAAGCLIPEQGITARDRVGDRVGHRRIQIVAALDDHGHRGGGHPATSVVHRIGKAVL